MKAIKIDLSKWTTPAKYAKDKGVSTNAVVKWISREQITYWVIPDLGLTLVKRGTETVGKYAKRNIE